MTKKSYLDRILSIAKKIKAISLLGDKCEICGETHYYKLCFHHKNPEDKEFTIKIGKKNRWSKILKEIFKCVLLCRNCHNELHYKLRNNSDTIYSKNKIKFLEYKNTFKCQKCGYDKCNDSLEFHHRNPEDKKFTISDYISHEMKNQNKLDDIIKKELNKCDVYCNNCHCELHADIEFFENYKDIIYEKLETLREIQPKINRDDVKKMYKEGMKQIYIAKHFNSSKGTISDIIKELNINTEYRTDEKTIEELYNQGYKNCEIIKKTGVKKSSYFAVLKRIKKRKLVIY